MTLTEYIEKKAKELGECHDIDEFNNILIVFKATLRESKIEVTDSIWDALKVAYHQAPKMMLKEATAAKKLVTLLDKADELIDNHKGKK